MSTRVVREDDKGLYVITNGQKYRPETHGRDYNGYNHAFDMGPGSLKFGDKVNASPWSGTELCGIHPDPETRLVWKSIGEYTYESR